MALQEMTRPTVLDSSTTVTASGWNRRMMRSPKSQSAAERDAALMAAVRDKQDARSLANLFEIYGPKLKGWLMSRGLGSGTAEDVVQDVMIKVWTRAELFDPSKASFATWVYRLTRNKWIDHQRKHGRVDVIDPDVMKVIADDLVEAPDEAYDVLEETEALRHEVGLLPEKQKILIHMAFMQHMTHQQISDETGIPLGTIKTRIRAAIKTLRIQMEKQ